MRTRTSKSRVFAHARPCFRGGTPQGIDGLRRLSLGARFRRQALAPTARPLGHWGLTAQRRPSEEASMTIECRQMPLSSELPRLWQRKCKEERVCRELLPLDSPHISPRLCRGIVTAGHFRFSNHDPKIQRQPWPSSGSKRHTTPSGWRAKRSGWSAAAARITGDRRPRETDWVRKVRAPAWQKLKRKKYLALTP